MTSCPTKKCSKGARCLDCLERDRLAREVPAVDGMTKQNIDSIVATLFGLVRRTRR